MIVWALCENAHTWQSETGIGELRTPHCPECGKRWWMQGRDPLATMPSTGEVVRSERYTDGR